MKVKYGVQNPNDDSSAFVTFTSAREATAYARTVSASTGEPVRVWSEQLDGLNRGNVWRYADVHPSGHVAR